MPAKRKPFVKLQCQDCKRINYYIKKSKGFDGKLELRKYCKWCRRHTLHKEAKK